MHTSMPISCSPKCIFLHAAVAQSITPARALKIGRTMELRLTREGGPYDADCPPPAKALLGRPAQSRKPRSLRGTQPHDDGLTRPPLYG